MAAPRSPEEERMQLAMALNASTISSARTNQYREDLARAMSVSRAHAERESEQLARALSLSLLETEARDAGNAFVNGLRTSHGGGSGRGGGGSVPSAPVATPLVRGPNRRCAARDMSRAARARRENCVWGGVCDGVYM